LAPASSLPLPAYVAFGVAAAAAVVGTVTGIVELDKTASLRSSCANHTCPPADAADVDRARTFATVSTLSLVGAGASVGVGLALWLIGHDRPSARAVDGVRVGF
jgi:hypothetical protein